MDPFLAQWATCCCSLDRKTTHTLALETWIESSRIRFLQRSTSKCRVDPISTQTILSHRGGHVVTPSHKNATFTFTRKRNIHSGTFRPLQKPKILSRPSNERMPTRNEKNANEHTKWRQPRRNHPSKRRLLPQASSHDGPVLGIGCHVGGHYCSLS